MDELTKLAAFSDALAQLRVEAKMTPGDLWPGRTDRGMPMNAIVRSVRTFVALRKAARDPQSRSTTP